MHQFKELLQFLICRIVAALYSHSSIYLRVAVVSVVVSVLENESSAERNSADSGPGTSFFGNGLLRNVVFSCIHLRDS